MFSGPFQMKKSAESKPPFSFGGCEKTKKQGKESLYEESINYVYGCGGCRCG